MSDKLELLFHSPALKALLVYLALISGTGMFLTIADKYKAIKGKWRIPEKELFLCGLLGGAGAMYLTMHIIRHKTKHGKFMVGFPLVIILQIGLFVILFLQI